MVRLAFIALFGALWPMLAGAQNEDRDYLTALLEDTLSGAGRQVVITGFEGALSSRARMKALTIADDDGVWIALKDVALDWTRSDLLAGKITVNTLTAAEISLTRLPRAGSDISAEAPAFSLPDLPVAINIGAISVDKLQLDAGILGQEVTAAASASMQLAGGEGGGKLMLQRADTDSAQGQVAVDIAFANETRWLKIDLVASETAGGVLAQVLGIPSAPALELTLTGDAPLTGFSADLSLASNGARRFGGQINWASLPQSTQFDIDLAGDIAPLFKPAFRPFFGDQISLRAQGATRSDGGFDIPNFALVSAAMDIAGRVSLAKSGLPDSFALNGSLRSQSGGALVLPLALSSPASITEARISAQFDASQSENFDVSGQMTGWQQDDLRVAIAGFTANGRLSQGANAGAVTAKLSISGEGVQPVSRPLSQALGTVIWGEGTLDWQPNGPLSLTQTRLAGENYEASLDGQLDGLAFTGKAALSAQDFSRFSGVLGRPIAGAGQAQYRGSLNVLTRAFDGEISAQTDDLAFGIAAVDASLVGPATIEISAARGAGGINLRKLDIAARGGAAHLTGQIASGNVQLSGGFDMRDLPIAQRGFGGSLAGQLQLGGALDDAMLTLSAQSDGLDLANPYVRKVAGQKTEVAAKIAIKDLSARLVKATLASPLLQADIAQQEAGGFDLSAKLADLAVIVPQFPGPLNLAGTIIPQDDGARLDLRLNGPAGVDARVAGQASLGQSNDLRISGRADAGLANAFIAPRTVSGTATYEMQLRGRPDISALSGSVQVQSGRLADPNLPFALDGASVLVQLAGGQAQVTGNAAASTGGQISLKGRIEARAPFAADMTIRLAEIGLRDPNLYETSIDGTLRLTGPLRDGPLQSSALLQGALDLGRTEVQLRVPKSIEGASLPNLQHRGDSAAVQATRRRAGIDLAQGSTARPIGLDIELRARNRLFVRGRGLDAELGGALRLQGDTGNVRPNGSFDLVQGHFDILTTRLKLETVRLELRGDFVPYLSVRAINSKGAVTTTAIIDGPALDPDFTFSSTPEMPEEDVLAQLLFDQSVRGLSALQGLQLTSAVASLTGRGEGIIAQVRKRLKLDNLDVQSNEDGSSALSLGKYVSKDVYSELSVEGAGKQSLDFTYSLNEKIKLRAGAATTGNASIGIEFETNY